MLIIYKALWEYKELQGMGLLLSSLKHSGYQTADIVNMGMSQKLTEN